MDLQKNVCASNTTGLEIHMRRSRGGGGGGGGGGGSSG